MEEDTNSTAVAEEAQSQEVPAEPELVEPAQEILAEELLVTAAAPEPIEEAKLKAILEAIVYITDEPLSAAQIAVALGQPTQTIAHMLEELAAEYAKPEHGLSLREVAGGYKMATKPEHHEAVRAFVKNLKPALKLSLAALETLAVIAYKQPITAPEIMEIRGVQGAGVLKTLLDRKLIATAGRKNVLGKPILYKSTKEFLLQFGLKDLSELPTLKEFEELGRLALSDADENALSISANGGPDDPVDPSEPIRDPDPRPIPERDPDPGDDVGSVEDPQEQPIRASD